MNQPSDPSPSSGRGPTPGVPPMSRDEVRTPPAPIPTAMDHVIPTKNMPALLGYYFGVFSIIPGLGIPLGIAAFICGVLGLRAAGKARVGGGHAVTALVLGTIFGGGQCLLLVAFLIYR